MFTGSGFAVHAYTPYTNARGRRQWQLVAPYRELFRAAQNQITLPSFAKYLSSPFERFTRFCYACMMR